ncbi:MULTISPECIES: hypothetical protein [unclassified Anabaena]|uniref:hypothetical protein n=1 Tax=unclassified Anabaena TaxID=2619674 RepID=UPI001444F104|nr:MULTISPECIES: hypothetical protein [unclassified Anabaena]MTJ07703.1 hypothetical protein [Anabaena sp. UHCC 0204]MTJ51331.1 hypothetical protein [Anabaena sp. UHCC 0253]
MTDKKEEEEEEEEEEGRGQLKINAPCQKSQSAIAKVTVGIAIESAKADFDCVAAYPSGSKLRVSVPEASF